MIYFMYNDTGLSSTKPVNAPLRKNEMVVRTKEPRVNVIRGRNTLTKPCKQLPPYRTTHPRKRKLQR